MAARRLVIFDVDGTLIDSQAHIVTCVGEAFGALGQTPPARGRVLSMVGLSLTEAFAMLAPDADPATQAALQDRYKAAFGAIHQTAAPAPPFPGADEVLEALSAVPGTVLAVATGNSRRGLDRILGQRGWARHFASTQTASEHPSKPHPSMIRAALAETGVAAGRTAMIGDTRWDIDMGKAAGVATVAVDWGYHPAADLGADAVLRRFADLPGLLLDVLER